MFDLRKFRKIEGLKQEDLARLFNCGQSNIANMERNAKITAVQWDVLADKYGLESVQKYKINEIKDGETEARMHRNDDSDSDLGKLVIALNNISEAVKLNAIANERNSRNMEKMIDLITEKHGPLNKQTGS